MEALAESGRTPPPGRALRIVVMGVSGCGKSTIGCLLAEALGLPYVEGDDLHPARNVEKMRAGTPLTDDDRSEWLDAVAERLARARGVGVVVSCSALRRSYRDRLRAAAPDLRLIHLQGSPALLAERLAARRGHYMPASLLHSQLQTLEPPDADERAVTLQIAQAPAQIVAEAFRALGVPAP